jgi:hypothetical protein
VAVELSPCVKSLADGLLPLMLGACADFQVAGQMPDRSQNALINVLNISANLPPIPESHQLH